MEQQELMMELYKAQAQTKEIEEKTRLVEQQLVELSRFSNNLEELNNRKEKEILASIGKGVYIKSDIKEDKLFVDVGSGVLLKKSISEAKEVVKDQTEKLIVMKTQLSDEAETINAEMKKLVEEAEKNK